jgi:hypothetical protein
VSEGGAEADDLSEFAALKDRLSLSMGWGQPLVVPDHEELAGGFRGLDHGAGVFAVVAMGFSQSTCLPAFSASMVSAHWSLL